MKFSCNFALWKLYLLNHFKVRADLVIRCLLICEFAYSALEKLVQKAEFPIIMCLFVCKFSIRGLIFQDVSTTNKEAHLYVFPQTLGILITL